MWKRSKRSKRAGSPIRRQLVAAVVGITGGGILITAAGKAVMELGIALLTGIAVVGSGFLVGVLLLPKRVAHYVRAR